LSCIWSPTNRTHFSLPACSQEKANGEKVEGEKQTELETSERVKTENLALGQDIVVAQKEETASKSVTSKPNILIIWGDDIGWFNPSVYHRGIMGYKTPNIDRIAKEGAMFTWTATTYCPTSKARSRKHPVKSSYTGPMVPIFRGCISNNGSSYSWSSGHTASTCGKNHSVPLRAPKPFTLRGDPFERADQEGIDYLHWCADRLFLLVPAQAYVAQWLQSFKEFPPRQKPAIFSIDR